MKTNIERDEKLIDEVKKILHTTDINHIDIGLLVYNHKDYEFVIFFSENKIGISSNRPFRFPGMKSRYESYKFKPDEIHNIPQHILRFIRDETSEHVDKLIKSVDELYMENSSSILNLYLLYGRPTTLICRRHNSRCGEAITKFHILNEALNNEMHHISNRISASVMMFDYVTFTKLTPTGGIELRFFLSKPENSVTINDSHPLVISRDKIQKTRELALLRNYLYNNSIIQPITLKVNL